MKSARIPSFRRVLVVGLSVAYTLTNVFGAHAGEIAFWGERRRAARDRTFSTPLKSDSLWAGLPGNPSTTSPYSPPFEPQSGVGFAGSSSRENPLVKSSDPRIHQIAQSIRPFGTIRFVQESKKSNAPLVLHIQDVHGNREAQRNMAEMVLALARDSKIRLVGLEGAWGPFAVDPFKAYPDQEIVKKVGQFFLKKDLIGGPEYAGLASEQPLTLWGIEDPGLYRANVDAVQESLAGQTRAVEFLSSFNQALASLKKERYSPRLHAFDQNQSLYHDQGQRGLGEYLQNLIDFSGKGFPSLSERIPNVQKFLNALQMEKTLNFQEVERERQDLVKVLTDKLSPAELQDLFGWSVDLRRGTLSHNTYHHYLRDLCARHGVALEHSPTLLAYMRYVADSEGIERDALLNEISILEIFAQDALVQTAEQRSLVDLSRDAVLLKKLLSIQMTPSEWLAYGERRTPIHNLESRWMKGNPTVGVQWPKDLKALLAPFEAFCDHALARNGALGGRLLEKMDRDGQSVAVLVAGGFHTDGLMATLRQRGASVVVLTPQLGPADITNRYLDVFAQDPIPLDKLFAGEPIALKSVCGLSLAQDKPTSTASLIHFLIVGYSLKLKEEFLRGLGTGRDRIQKGLNQLIEDLNGRIASLVPMHLAVDLAGEGGLLLSGALNNSGREKARFFGEGNAPPHVSFSESNRDGRGVGTTGLSPSGRKPRGSNRVFSRFPGTAIPGLVSFIRSTFGVPEQQAIWFYANVVQSALFPFILFVALTVLDPMGWPSWVVPLGVYILFSHFSAEFRRNIFRYDRGNKLWSLQPIRAGATKHVVRITELIFNAPFFAFHLMDLSLPSPYFMAWWINLYIVSVLLRVGYHFLPRHFNGDGISPPTPQSSKRTQMVVDAFQAGTLAQCISLLPSSLSLLKVEFDLTKIAEDTVRQAIGGAKFKRILSADDGPFKVYESDELDVVIKVPNDDFMKSMGVSEESLRRSFIGIKNNMGGFFTPLTFLNAYSIRVQGKPVEHPFVIVQEQVKALPLRPEEWDVNLTPANTEGVSPKAEAQEWISHRQGWITDFYWAMGQRGFSYTRRDRKELSLGLSGGKNIVAHRLDGLVPIGTAVVEGVRVHDVFAAEISAAQKAYLTRLFQEARSPKPHSLLSFHSSARFLGGMGLSETFSTHGAKFLVAFVIPIFETIGYGLSTVPLALFLSSGPLGHGGALLAPVIVGLISAVIHVLGWKGQGEKVSKDDFIGWWVMAALYSLPFVLMSPTGWAGETPWILSGGTHALINGLIVGGTAHRLGRSLGWKWLRGLKLGAVVPERKLGSLWKSPLSPTDLFRIKRDLIFPAIHSFSDRGGAHGFNREFDLVDENNKPYLLQIGKGDEFNQSLAAQIRDLKSGNSDASHRLIDYGIELQGISYMLTEEILTLAEPPLDISEETMIRSFANKIAATHAQKGGGSLNRIFLQQLVDELASEGTTNGHPRQVLPSKGLMATAGAVALTALKSQKYSPADIMDYLLQAKTFRDIIAINPDRRATDSAYAQFSFAYDEETTQESLSIDPVSGQRFLDFIRSRKDNTEGKHPNRPPDGPQKKIRQEIDNNPFPLVGSWELDFTHREELNLQELFLGGSRPVGLDFLFRRYKPAMEAPEDIPRFHNHLRQKVKEMWKDNQRKDQWLSALRPQDWRGVDLAVAENRFWSEQREGLRWWALGEMWLAVATPRDWFNWRYWVLRFRERRLFHGGQGFTVKDRLDRAAALTAYLRAAGTSILNERRWNDTDQTNDVDLLLSALASARNSTPSHRESAFRSYNGVLEQSARIDLWIKFFKTTILQPPAPTPESLVPGGVLIFDLDALTIEGSQVNKALQREVASALAAVLLSLPKENLKRTVYFVTSMKRKPGAQTPLSDEISKSLTQKYGPIFDRLRHVTFVSRENKIDGLFTEENGQPSLLHLDPLLNYLFPNAPPESVNFWTHDETHVKKGKWTVQISDMVRLADKIQKFFQTQTFLQINA